MTLATTDAGTDAVSGRKRLLVPVRIGPAVNNDREEECVPHELWLVTESAGAFEIEQLLLADCTRATPWPGETTVTGDEASIEHSSAVPSNWFARSVVLSFDLSWPSFAGITASYAFQLNPCPSEVVSSFDGGFASHVTWARTREYREETEPGVWGGGAVCTEERAYVPIPLVLLPPAFEDGGFRTLPFDGCSTAIDGTGGARGVAVSGATAGAADATFRVVLSKRSFLYVDVVDDHFTGSSADPSTDDHVEIWTSPRYDSYMNEPEELPKPARFAIRVADGRVFGEKTAAASVVVERVERQGRVILRLRLPGSAEKLLESGLSVAYVDIDPGQPRAIVATSPAEAGTASSLGVARAVHDAVTCRIDGGELMRSVPGKGREKPLYGP